MQTEFLSGRDIPAATRREKNRKHNANGYACGHGDTSPRDAHDDQPGGPSEAPSSLHGAALELAGMAIQSADPISLARLCEVLAALSQGNRLQGYYIDFCSPGGSNPAADISVTSCEGPDGDDRMKLFYAVALMGEPAGSC